MNRRSHRVWPLTLAIAGAALGSEPPAPPVPSNPQTPQETTRRAELFTAEQAAQENLLVVLPRKTEMGFVPVGDERHRRLWVINPSETDRLRIKALRFDCGCTTAPDFQPMTLEPLEIRHVDLKTHAPSEAGKRRDVRAFFVLENGDAVFSTLHLQTVEQGSAFSIDPPISDADVLVLPDEVHLGDLPLGERGEATVWIVNRSKQPRQVEKLRTSCPCLTAPEFEPNTIAPGKAMRIDLRLRPETQPLDERRVRLYALDNTGGLMAEMQVIYSSGKTTPGETGGWNTIDQTRRDADESTYRQEIKR